MTDKGVFDIKMCKCGMMTVGDNPDADPYSDVAYFKDGIKWAYAAKEWAKVD